MSRLRFLLAGALALQLASAFGPGIGGSTSREATPGGLRLATPDLRDIARKAFDRTLPEAQDRDASGMRPGSPSQVCSGSCPGLGLVAAEVERILRQGFNEAQLLGVAATIAVVDRVGNVLGVYQTPPAPPSSPMTMVSVGRMVDCDFSPTRPFGLEGCMVRSSFAAISKAGTAAYLSTQGNAFSTRTAGQIVQQHFNPGERFRPGGPLFGVQFSQLPCGDLVRNLGGGVGPKRMPLGFSADPGGLPLFVWGVAVGGVGVELDGVYDADLKITDRDTDLEERIAAAASSGFAAPVDRRADRISVDGRFLRFADDERFASAFPHPLAALAVPAAAPGFWAGAIVDGAVYGMAESGIVPTIFEGIAGEILVEADGTTPRFPPASSLVPGGPTASEVRVVLREALRVAEAARAQIRRPAGSKARVSISVVDTDGEILGIVRSTDAPIFGIDVSLQKARTAAFFSSQNAAADLMAEGFGTYVQAVRAFLGDPNALSGDIAFSDRAGGNLARPFFPDGVDGRPNGPLSKPISHWSPFNTGLQLDLVFDALISVLLGGAPTSCTGASLSEIRNGIQIFPGSVPIYRGTTLVGGIGISGDGVDQDDLIAFLGLHNASLALGGALGNAPRHIRADTLPTPSGRLRYVNCPPAPFNGRSEQNVCEDK